MAKARPDPGLDAFGRMRVSDPLTLFDSQQQYNTAPLIFEDVGTGTVVHLPDEAATKLSVAAGGNIYRQSRQYVRYKPGKSQLILLTFVFGETPTDDLVRRVGYYDDENGIFLQQDADGLHWVRRSSATGSVVDEKVANAEWTRDNELQLDASKALLAFIDLEWLGVGQVRVGFFLRGQPLHTHVFNASPALDRVYMATANLPVRYEVTSAVNESGFMKQICSAVISEGGFEEEYGYPQSRDTFGAGTAISTTMTPVLAIRPKATFNGLVNRGLILPESIEVFADANAAWRVYYNADVTTGASWVSQSANSITEYEVSGTAMTTTNAELIASGFVAAGNKSGTSGGSLSVRLPITLDAAGANPVEIVVAMATLTGTGTGYAAAYWKEIY